MNAAGLPPQGLWQHPSHDDIPVNFSPISRVSLRIVYYPNDNPINDIATGDVLSDLPGRARR
ncbi:conserved hypothetical protein [Klebsiella variicola]|nr:conserved hypothetical protein [Klebsiella variicola]